MRQRTEVSKKRDYWIPKNRFLELKYLCMQIDDINAICEDARRTISSAGGYLNGDEVTMPIGMISDPVYKAVEIIAKYNGRVRPLENAIKYMTSHFGEDVADMISIGVRNNIGYDKICARMGRSPVSKAAYYEAYHWFFWWLDQFRN